MEGNIKEKQRLIGIDREPQMTTCHGEEVHDLISISTQIHYMHGLCQYGKVLKLQHLELILWFHFGDALNFVYYFLEPLCFLSILVFILLKSQIEYEFVHLHPQETLGDWESYKHL